MKHRDAVAPVPGPAVRPIRIHPPHDRRRGFVEVRGEEAAAAGGRDEGGFDPAVGGVVEGVFEEGG